MELALHNLEKKYKQFAAVSGVTYSMTEGIYGLLGVNGAGKTTLMKMICTRLRPTFGKIEYNGNDIFDLGSHYRKILGYLPQDFGFYPEFTVKDYLMYIASIKGLSPGTAEKKIQFLLNEVELTEYINIRMKKLSGGMKRRVGIAQAMLNNPKILILDEPTAGLDPNERIRFRNLITGLAENRLVLLSTHIVSDVENIANEILLMKNGRICMSGTMSDILLTMSDKVWIVRAAKNEGEKIKKKYKVSNMKLYEDMIEIRLISHDKPTDSAIPVKTTLEDLFLYYFGEKVSE